MWRLEVANVVLNLELRLCGLPYPCLGRAHRYQEKQAIRPLYGTQLPVVQRRSVRSVPSKEGKPGHSRLMEMAIQAAREIIIALGHTVQKVFISTSLDFQ